MHTYVYGVPIVSVLGCAVSTTSSVDRQQPVQMHACWACAIPGVLPCLHSVYVGVFSQQHGNVMGPKKSTQLLGDRGTS